MKKRVFSILLALALCLTLLPAAAWAEETGTNGDETCVHDWEWVPTDAGYNHISKCKKCTAQGTTMQHDNASGYCSFCHAQLKARVNQSGFYTSLQKALHGAGSNKILIAVKQTVYPIGDQQESITYSETVNENVTLNLNRATIESLTVTAGTLKIEGSGAINTLTVTGGTVQLSGGTYGTITPPAGKSVNDLLAPGYYAVQTANGISVQQAPITNVTVSVSNNENTVYGYSEADAPVLTATVTPSDLQGVTYQWYKVNGSKKTAINNATAQTYTVETGLNAGDYDYCCTATVDTYSLTSGDVTVTIKKANGPQLGTINVNQVYNDTASKTIEIYDQVIGKLNEAFPNGGTMEFQGDGYESADGLTLNGWQIDVNSGSITYTMGENTAPEKKITIKYKAFAHKGNYKNNYEYAEGTVVITLTKITPTGIPNYTPITSSGKTLADAHLNANNNAFSVPGAVEWVLEGNQTPEDVTVVKGARYAWKFTPDEDNSAIYEGLTGTIIPWTESGSGAVIITPSQSGESTPASNPNTGAAHVGQPLPGLALLALAALCLYAGTRRF